jgi:succinoglycan biosynthesis protein ExoH
MDDELSRRIWITRYLMVIGIVILHIPPHQPLSGIGHSLFEYIDAIFSQGFFRATIPLLTAISGYLLFNSKVYLTPLNLLYKKLNSLLVPLLLWNIPLVTLIYLMQKYQLTSHVFNISLYPFNVEAFLNGVIGMLDRPVNSPLHFLRDLFVISLLSPLLWKILRYIPYVGFFMILLIYLFNLDGTLILTNSMLVSFYLGALAATQKWNLSLLDKYAVLLAILTVFIISMILYFRSSILLEVYILIAPFIIWPVISLIINTSIGDYLYKNSKNSIMLYLAHNPLLVLSWIVFNKIPGEFPYVLYWIITPVLIIFITGWVGYIMHKKIPRIYAVLVGNR